MLQGQMSSVRLSSGHDDFLCTNLGQDVARAADRAVGCAFGQSDEPIRSGAADPTDEDQWVGWILRTAMDAPAADPMNGQRIFMVNFR
jgi:hypothetical protein